MNNLELLKSIGKFILRSKFRTKIFREIKIKNAQAKYLVENNGSAKDSIIIFVIDGADINTGKEIITGGIMSIASIYEETLKLKDIHKSDVLICTHPEVQHLIFEFQQFESTARVLRLEQVLNYYKDVENVLLHIPEYLYPFFVGLFKKKETERLFSNRKVHINIMNQNIRLMPKPDFIKLTKVLFNKITMTTAHEQYSTREVASAYQIPLHKLSVYGGPERYKYIEYNQKDNLLIVSPDDHPLKDSILSSIRKALPEIEIIEIRNIPYSEYRKFILKAKWALTFGEGLDYYFLETVFSGGISFAVFNDLFFTKEFKKLKTVYENVEQLATNIINNIISLDSCKEFTKYNHEQFTVCEKLYNHDEYINNIKLFYAEKYTYPLTESYDVK